MNPVFRGGCIDAYRHASDQAAGLRSMLHQGSLRLLAVAGPPGVGRSAIAARLAQFAARSMPVLLLDQTGGEALREMGPAAHADLDDVLRGEVSFDRAAQGAGACRYLHARRLIPRLQAARVPCTDFLDALTQHAGGLRLVVLNLAPGDAHLPQVVDDGEVLLVTTPRPAALTAAYVEIKQRALAAAPEFARVRVLVNGVLDDAEGARVFRTLAETARRHLGTQIEFAGSIPQEPGLPPYGCVRDASLHGRAGIALEQIASAMPAWSLAAVPAQQPPSFSSSRAYSFQ